MESVSKSLSLYYNGQMITASANIILCKLSPRDFDKTVINENFQQTVLVSLIKLLIMIINNIFVTNYNFLLYNVEASVCSIYV